MHSLSLEPTLHRIEDIEIIYAGRQHMSDHI